MNDMKKIIVVCGPTGIGKTSFAIKLAAFFNGEIISADSMQIYRHMNIGTAKPDSKELKNAEHHLIDFFDPADEFDAGMFVKAADEAVSNITGQGKIPIVAGGTGLYIKALLHGLFRVQPVCEKTLSLLNRELKEKGRLHLHKKLEHCDPETAKRVHPNDSFRVIRALEFYHTNGNKISEQKIKHSFNENRYEYIKIGLYMERKKLYARINQRVDMMISQGLLSEVENLVEKGYSLNLKAMQSIGYKHMGMFIKNQVEWDEAVRLLKRDTRRYAKRQFTWFNKDKEVIWLKPLEIENARKLIKEFLT